MDTTTQTGTTDKNVQEELKDSVHRIWLAGLGALSAAEEEGGKIFTRLVERGRDVESRGKVEVDKVKVEVDKMKTKAESAFETWGDKFDEKLTSTLNRLGPVRKAREEMSSLRNRLEELEVSLAELERTDHTVGTEPKNGRPAERKPAARIETEGEVIK